MKIYLMAPPCSGKTHFARAHPRYRGYRVVDFSPLNKRAVKDPAYGASALPGQTYFERILTFLATQAAPLCVLGRCGPDKPASLTSIVLAAVLPSVAQHRHNSDCRRAAHAASKWADFEEVQRARASVSEYVERHGVPLYESFEEALANLLKEDR